jgi:hypothetical protein
VKIVSLVDDKTFYCLNIGKPGHLFGDEFKKTVVTARQNQKDNVISECGEKDAP